MSNIREFEEGWSKLGRLILPEVVVQQFREQQEKKQIEIKRLDAEAAEALKKRKAESDLEVEAQNPLTQTCPIDPEPTFSIFQQSEVDEVYRTLDSRYTESDDRKRARKLIELLQERGADRKLTPIPSDWTLLLDRMLKKFPNFASVIQYLRGMFTLASYGDGVAHFAPILLNGPPGVGKTYFAEQLANELNIGFKCLRMENSQSNSAISGSSEFWSNAKPGEVFAWLIEKDNANPIFFLDEIDKIGGDSRYDPMTSLYSLFEPSTASTFSDLCFPWLTLNASRVIWICTSNNADLLPKPILSRVRRFDIPMPEKREARRLVLQIFNQLKKELPPVVSTLRPTNATVELLAAQSPRRIKQLLLEAVSRTLMRGGQRVGVSDLAIQADSGQTRAIGFVK